MFENFPEKYLRILELMSQGLIMREVAERMDMNEQYIKNILTRVYRELGVKNGTGAVALYIKWKLRMNEA